MEHWIGHIRGTEYTAFNILHMKHRGGSGVDFTNLVLYFALVTNFDGALGKS